MGVFLRAYDRNGTALGLMPDFTDLSVQTADNAPGTMTFKYLRDGVGQSYLNLDELFLSVVEDGVESPDLFQLEEDTDDPVSTLTQTQRRWVTVAARGYMAVLDQCVVYPPGYNGQSNLTGLKPEYKFDDVTPGRVMQVLVTNAKARGGLNELIRTWSDTHDSAGRPWPKTFDITYPVGTNYLQVLNSMIEDGWVDARTYGRNLQLFVPDTYFGNTGYVLRYGQNVLAAPRKRSRRDIFSHMLSLGDAEKKAAFQVSRPDTQARFGRREGFVSDGNRKTKASLEWIGNVELGKHQQLKEGFTLDMAMNPPGPGEWWPRPGIDFRCGDKIYYDRYEDSAGNYQPLLVRSITKNWGDTKGAATASIEVGDLFLKASSRVASQVSAVTGGSTGVRAPAPKAPQRDTMPPVSPTNVTLTGASVLHDEKVRKVWRSTATATWPAVTQDSDGTDIEDLDGYEVSVQINNGPWSAARVAVGREEVIDGLKPQDLVRVRVLAKDYNGNRSDWIVSDAVAMPLDTTPPNVPTAPILTEKASVVTCRWDGLGEPGNVPMPEDFNHVLVQRSLSSTFASGVLEVGRLYEPDATVLVTTQVYGDLWYYRFLAVDVNGNRSAPSAASSIATTPLVTGDLPQQIINDLDAAATEAHDAYLAAAAAQGTADAAATQTAFDAAMQDLDANYYTKPETETYVQTTANGRTKIYSATTDAPATGTYVAGDIWRKYDTLANGGKLLAEWTYTLPGGMWVTRVYSGLVVTELNAASITAGFLDAARINTNALTIGQVNGLQGGLDAKLPTISSSAASKVFRNVLQTVHLGGSNVSGSIVIKTPITFGNYMTRVKIVGYQYAGTGDIDLDVGFYAYNVGPVLTNPSLRINGSFGVTARYAKDANNKVVIILDPPSGSTWQYPRIEVPEVSVGLTLPPDSFGTGWSAAIETDLTPYTSVVTPTTLDSAGGSRLANGWRKTGKTTIDGGNIEADSVLATAIKANTIGVKQMAVGDMSNYCELDETTAGLVLPDTGITHVIETVSNVRWSKRSATTGPYFFFRNGHGPLPFKAGDRLRLTFDAFADAAVTPTPYVWTYGTTNVWAAFAAAPTPAGGTAWPTQITTAVQSFAYEVVVPALTDQTTFIVGLSGLTGRDVRVKNARCYRMGAGELIVDGTIEGKHIKAGTVDADRIIASTLTIGKVQDLSNQLAGKEVAGAAAAAQTAAQNYADTNYSATKTRVNTWTFSGQTKIDGGQIQADTIDGVIIKAHTIGADQLVVGGATNLIPNGAGEYQSLGGWAATTSSLTFDTVDKPAGIYGAFKSVPSAPTYSPPSLFWDVEPGSEFYCEVWLKADKPNSRLYIEMRDQAGGHAGTAVLLPDETAATTTDSQYLVNNFTVPTVWTRYAVIYKAAATTTRMKLGAVYFNHSAGTERTATVSIAIRVRGRGTGRLLVDGSIEAKHIKANSIKADAIDVGAIDVQHLKAGVLRTNMVADPGFEEAYAFTAFAAGAQGPTHQWRTVTSGPGTLQVVRQLSRARSGSKRLTFSAGTGADATSSLQAISSSMPVGDAAVDKTYRVSWYAVATGAGSTTPNTPKIKAEVIFGPTADTLDPATPTALSEGDTNPPYALLADITSGTYQRFAADFTVTAGTPKFAALRFTATGNVADTTIMVDDVSVVEQGGGASELTAAGLRLFDEDGDEDTALVTNRPSRLTIARDGLTLASITEDGNAGFQTIDAMGDFTYQSSPLLGRMFRQFSNREFNTSAGWDVTNSVARNYEAEPIGVLEAVSAGVVGWHGANNTPTTVLQAAGAYVRINQVNVDLEPGRIYSITTSPYLATVPTNAVCALMLRYTLNDTEPTVSSPILARCYHTGSGNFETFQIADRPLAGTASQRTLRILAVFQYLSGSGNVSPAGDPFFLSVYDRGYGVPPNSGNLINATTQAVDPAPTPAPTKKTYVSTWNATNSQTRRGSSASYGAYTVNPTSVTGSTSMLAGYYSSGNGNQFSLIEFGGTAVGGEVGSSIANALRNGATISKVEVYVKNTSFYSSAGGTQYFSWGGWADLNAYSSGYPSAAYTTKSFTTGQGQWVTLPSSAAASIINGGRVAAIGPGRKSSTDGAIDNSKSYYSKWVNHAASSGRPQLRLTYTR